MPDHLYEAAASLFEQQASLRLLLASLLGAAVGLERERAHKAAGLRTNILICLGAALVMEISRELAKLYGDPVDTSRMAGQVVSGIGFIGAGTILVARGQVVVGLTTAATIWVVAAIGLAVGAEAYAHAIFTTLLIVVVLALLGWMEAALFEEPRVESVEVDLAPDPAPLQRVKSILAEAETASRVVEMEKGDDGLRLVVEIRGRERDRQAVFERIGGLPSVRRIGLVAAKSAAGASGAAGGDG